MCRVSVQAERLGANNALAPSFHEWKGRGQKRVLLLARRRRAAGALRQAQWPGSVDGVGLFRSELDDHVGRFGLMGCEARPLGVIQLASFTTLPDADPSSSPAAGSTM